MLTFRPITTDDRAAMHEFFYRAQGHGSEYSFANLFSWGDQRVCFVDGEPLILSRFGSWVCYLFPRDPKHIATLRDDAHERGIKFRLCGLNAQEAAQLDGQDFTVTKERDIFDYVYQIERLCSLSGKKLQAKRNHCNRFAAENPNCQIVPLTSQMLDDCRKLVERWYLEHEQSTENDYRSEKSAIERTFRNFDALKMEGLALLTNGTMVAFCMGNRIREDTFDVNYEKALADIHGAYPTINRAFACYIHEKYPEVRYINREDDMGLAGLRKAKESYYPDLLLEKMIAEEIR